MDLVIDFGSAYGIWTLLNATQWRQVHPLSAQHIVAADLDNNGRMDLVVDFGSVYGIWTLLNAAQWRQVHPLSAREIEATNFDGR
jgi:hypothetical protein